MPESKALSQRHDLRRNNLPHVVKKSDSGYSSSLRCQFRLRSLIDVSDLEFVDAPGTGFSRIAGKDKETAFYGVDQDARAFGEFISQFPSKYGRRPHRSICSAKTTALLAPRS
jgi:hypothetical protein